MIFDSSKLKGLMKEKDITQDEAAKEIKISTSTFNLKINGNAYFSQEEIYKLSNLLGISGELYGQYFFTLKV